MLLALVNFARGSVRLKITGAYIERFLNICAMNDISFWNIKREDIDVIYANVHIGGFRKLRRYARRCMCHIKIVKKRGIPFMTKEIRYRYALLGGALLSVAVLWILSGFIWTIEITGCSQTSPAQVLKSLNELGLKPGVLRGIIDENAIRNDMLIRMEDLSWLAVNLKGTRAEVQVREREKKPYLIPLDVPCNILASKTGIISSMYVMDGTAKTLVGNTVMKGDILVESAMTSVKQATTRYVHAMAEVKARTWYTLRAVMPLSASRKEYTGRAKNRYALVFGNLHVNLSLNGSIPFEKCDKMINKKELIFKDSLVLPLGLIKETYREYTETESAVEGDTVIESLKESLKSRLRFLTGGGDIVTADFTVMEEEGLLEVVLTSECIEDIAQSVALQK